MDIQSKVRQAMQGQMKTLGGQDLMIGDTTIIAVAGEVDSDRSLIGGSREQRDIDVNFPTVKGLKIRKGSVCHYDDQKWRIENFRIGRAMTTLMLIEPNRKEE